MWQALGLMFVAMSMIPAGDMAGKLLTNLHGASPVFVAWSRFALGTAMILPFVPRGALALLRDWRIVLRAMILACGILSIQTALRTEPLANVFAAFFIGPIVSYTLSALLLREPITGARTALMALGFCGVLLVVRPGFGMSQGMVFAVMAGCFYGAFLTASRWLSDRGSPVALIFTQLAISAVLLAPFGIRAIPPLDWEVSALALASAGFSMLGNLLLLRAYARAASTHLAPFVYLQLLAAVLLGWLVLGDWPDWITWAGLMLVIGSGVASAALRR
jgi:drug/metabolite transporter (DMT)-like permease